MSPVVAAIILIAVTVAVSIAVAAWMGALTYTYMKTEELKISAVKFPANNQIDITIRNIGSASVLITEAKVGNDVQDIDPDVTVDPGEETTFSVTYAWSNSASYDVAVVTVSGNVFTYRATAPSTP